MNMELNNLIVEAMIRNDFVERILSSNGKIFSVEFIKKDGTKRLMNCRLGVTKHLKGGASTLDPNQFITVYDLQSQGYRAINVDTFLNVKGV
jgi:hypothetical protein